MSRAMQPARTMTQTLDDIISDFELIDDWDERYRYLIELGRTLEPLPESARTEANRVKGCASQVWLETARGSDGALLFRGDSDAHIVKGLVRLAAGVDRDRHRPRLRAAGPQPASHAPALERRARHDGAHQIGCAGCSRSLNGGSDKPFVSSQAAMSDRSSDNHPRMRPAPGPDASAAMP
jgi:cysteine desulfuration protein SufE